MKPFRSRDGFMLVTVLIITAVGLLFGAGALLLFKFQCQLRIDRQHELEKVYAVRSALNYCRTKNDIPYNGKSFKYYTDSERDLRVIVKPVEPIFPKDTTNHFFMANDVINGGFKIPCLNQYNKERDYEYGVMGATNNYDLTTALKIEGTNLQVEKIKRPGIAFTDTASTNTKWWVNIGMKGTGGWLQEEYGRRYYFYLDDFLGSITKDTSDQYGDIMRLCIIRNVTNNTESVSNVCSHGWPLSMNNERALVLEVQPLSKSGKKCTIMRIYEYRYGDIPKLRFEESFSDVSCYMGMQIAQRMITIFYIDKRGGGDPRLLPYTFIENKTIEMSMDLYNYFAKEVEIGNKLYGGIITNQITGRVEAPELRAVLEVEAMSSLRTGTQLVDDGYERITDFRVTPAYQYDIFLEHPQLITNRATVAQRVLTGKYNVLGTGNTVRTYDTHGTENKGFRKDEKLARENKGRTQ